MKSKRTNIGFIGAGNMASALIAGLIGDGFNNSHIFASSPEDDHLESCLLYTSPSPRD